MPRPGRSTAPIAAALAALLVTASCAPSALADPQPPSVTPMRTGPTHTQAPPPIAAPDPIPSPSPAPSVAPTAVGVPTGLAAPPDIRRVGGIEFARLGTVADLHVESAISVTDAALIEAQVADDIQAVEREFGMTFAGPPEIYVFGTTASYARGMSRIFGYPSRTADWIAENSVAFFEPPLGLIGVNWEAVGDRRPVAAFRHELTHLLTLRACAPRCDLVPAWLNEGQGRIAEAYLPGADWRLLRVRYEAASMAATGTLIPLSSLVTQHAWNSLTGWAGYYKYQQAARVTELLRADIGGDAPIARLYERIRRGESVSRAYAALTGRSFDDFVAELPDRILSDTDEGPGLITIPTAPDGPGASYLLYGLAPDSAVEVTITGERVEMSTRTEVSPFGSLFESLLPGLPRGVYAITVTAVGMVMTATVVKNASTGGPY